MRTRKRAAFILASAAALGVSMFALTASAVAAPPVVAACTPKASTGSDSCVRLEVRGTGAAGIQAPYENLARLGVRVSSVFSPTTHETSSVTLRFDDDIKLNLNGIPACPAAEVTGKNVAAAWEQCGPGADTNPPTEGNAYLSTGLGANVSGFGSTVPPGNFAACTMIFKGADNNHVTIYARAPVTPGTGCNTPASNTQGTTTVVFTGTLSHQPAASPYDVTLAVPGTSAANPALDDFYASLSRGAAFQARCPAGQSPHKIQGTWTYTPVAGDPADTVSPPYAGTQDPCAAP